MRARITIITPDISWSRLKELLATIYNNHTECQIGIKVHHVPGFPTPIAGQMIRVKKGEVSKVE